MRQIRPVRPSEYERAGALVVAAYAALPGAHSSPEYDRELADVDRRVAGAEVLVAVEAAGAGGPEHLLGCVTFVPDMDSPFAELLEEGESGVRMLAVDPAAQGHGVGGELLSACIERAGALQRRALVLHSTPWMTVAHRLYEKAGFAREPARDWMPVPEVPLLAYRLDLSRGAGGTT